MAGKKSLKADTSPLIFDTRRRAVMAHVNHDGIREKVQHVREVVPGKGNNEIVLVLQFYDYDVEKTIQAYLEDGAQEALKEWHFPGNKPKNKNKKKNKSIAKSKDSEQTKQDTEQQVTTAANITNGPQAPEETKTTIATTTTIKATAKTTTTATTKSKDEKPMKPSSASSSSQVRQHNKSKFNQSISLPDAKVESPSPERKNKSTITATTAKSHQRERTISEQSTSSLSGKKGGNKIHAGLEKSTKDLQRQTISLQRLDLLFKEEIEKSNKRLKNVFEEIRKEVSNREVALMLEMDKLKESGNEVLRMRQEKAAELKMKTDKHLNDQEQAELRADIKLFVGDRKIDEDLGRTIRFMHDSDSLLKGIREFGEVVPVKASYSQRRPSVSSIASSELNHHELPSPGIDKHMLSLAEDQTEGNIEIKDSSLTSHELAELQERLKNTMRLQGIPVKSPPRNSPNKPSSTGKPRTTSPSKKPDSQKSAEDTSQKPRDDFRKNRNAQRRQRFRERQRQHKDRDSIESESPEKPAAAATPVVNQEDGDKTKTETPSGKPDTKSNPASPKQALPKRERQPRVRNSPKKNGSTDDIVNGKTNGDVNGNAHHNDTPEVTDPSKLKADLKKLEESSTPKINGDVLVNGEVNHLNGLRD